MTWQVSVPVETKAGAEQIARFLRRHNDQADLVIEERHAKSVEHIRVQRQDVLELASKRAAELTAIGDPLSSDDIEEAARLGAIVATLNWVLDEDERPDWAFLGIITG